MQQISFDSVLQWGKCGNARIPDSISTVCPRCGRSGILGLTNHQNDNERLTVASTAKCSGCRKDVHFWSIRGERVPKDESANPSALYMYPPVRDFYPQPQFTPDVPERLQRSFISTIDSFNSGNYVATATGARRTLEGIIKFVIKDPQPKGTLADWIDRAIDIDLAAPLTSLSHAIRGGGNLGAHFDDEKEPNADIARQMIELLEYLLSYLYILPKKIESLEHSLDSTDP